MRLHTKQHKLETLISTGPPAGTQQQRLKTAAHITGQKIQTIQPTHRRAISPANKLCCVHLSRHRRRRGLSRSAPALPSALCPAETPRSALPAPQARCLGPAPTPPLRRAVSLRPPDLGHVPAPPSSPVSHHGARGDQAPLSPTRAGGPHLAPGAQLGRGDLSPLGRWGRGNDTRRL